MRINLNFCLHSHWGVVQQLLRLLSRCEQACIVGFIIWSVVNNPLFRDYLYINLRPCRISYSYNSFCKLNRSFCKYSTDKVPKGSVSKVSQCCSSRFQSAPLIVYDVTDVMSYSFAAVQIDFARQCIYKHGLFA